MQNKLQELTDKLYNEGLSKGKQEAEQMKANAKNEAAQIIAQAKEQAAQIIAQAQAEAAELKAKTENDVKAASAQTFTAVKQQIESVITAKSLAPSKSAVAETEFLKEIVKAVVTAFNPKNSDSVALDIILPAEKQAELEQFAKEQLGKICSAGVDVQFSKGVQGGFKIAPKGEGYMLSFTDKDFENIISEYLRPKTKALLFG